MPVGDTARKRPLPQLKLDRLFDLFPDASAVRGQFLDGCQAGSAFRRLRISGGVSEPKKRIYALDISRRPAAMCIR